MESEEKVEWMNNALWTYDANSFLPHGSAKDGNSELQPIYLTSQKENPNHSTLLVITDSSDLEPDADFSRVIDIFDGTNETTVANARERWKHYKTLGHTLEYRRQSETGAWKTG
jgi:DNA polymerase-3 subunit chi